jgi:Protein kinase domain
MGKPRMSRAKDSPALRTVTKHMPKCPPRPFAMYFRSLYMTAEKDHRRRADIMREAAERWRNMPQGAQQIWKEKYQSALKAFKDDCAAAAAGRNSDAALVAAAGRGSSSAVLPVVAGSSFSTPPAVAAASVAAAGCSSSAAPACSAIVKVKKESVLAAVACPSPAVHALPEADSDGKSSICDPGLPHGISAHQVQEGASGKGQSSVMLGRFAVLDASLLGSGSFGTVVKVEDTHTRRLYAAKVFVDDGRDCQHELQVYHSLADAPHPAFLPLLGAHRSRSMSWFVLPWCTGSLAQHTRSTETLSKEVTYGVANQLRIGLQHVHSIGWLHLDVKPGNVLYDPRTRHASLCDFSISERYPVRPEVAKSTRTWVTEPYRPPELFRKPSGMHLSAAVDTWSLGCTVFEAGCGSRLFSGDERAMRSAIVSFGTTEPPKTWGAAPMWCQQLIAVMCCAVPAQRWKLRCPFSMPGV